MSLRKWIFGRKPSGTVPQTPVDGGGDPSWQILALKKNDSPLRIDAATISHAFILLTLNDMEFQNTARQEVAAFNRACFPKIWTVPFQAQFGTFAAKPRSDGYPEPYVLPSALATVGLASHSSIVTQTLRVTFAGAKRQSRVWAGFTFRDTHPRRLIVPQDGERIVPR